MAEKKLRLTGQQLLNAIRGEQAKVEAMQRKQQTLQAVLMEMGQAIESLNAIKGSMKGERIMVSLGAGLYVDALLDSTSEVKTGLAGSVMVNSRIKDAIETLEKRKQGIVKTMESQNTEIEKSIQNANNLSRIFQHAQQKKQGNEKAEE